MWNVLICAGLSAMATQRRSTDLVRQAQAGDTESLGILLEHWRPYMYSRALQPLSSRDAAEDAVQDAYVIALSRIAGIRNPASFGSWIYAVVTNVCRGMLRKSGRVGAAYLGLERYLYLHHPEQVAEHYLESVAVKDLVWRALSGLGEDLRVAVMLRYFSSYHSYEEIALILGVPVGIVRSRLAAAKDQLLRQLQTVRPAHAEASAATTAFTVKTLGDIWRSLWQGDARPFDFFDADLRFTFVYPGAPPSSHSGIASWKDEVRGDVLAGTVVYPDRVIVSHTVSIVEGRIENAPETPTRCLPVP